MQLNWVQWGTTYTEWKWEGNALAGSLGEAGGEQQRMGEIKIHFIHTWNCQQTSKSSIFWKNLEGNKILMFLPVSINVDSICSLPTLWKLTSLTLYIDSVFIFENKWIHDYSSLVFETPLKRFFFHFAMWRKKELLVFPLPPPGRPS